MSPPTKNLPRAAAVTAAAIHRGRGAPARAALTLAVLTAAAAGTMAAGAGPAAAAPAVLYAAPAAAGTGDCSTAQNACTLTTALGQVAPGGTIELVTPGGTAHYVGNWTVSTTSTTATTPVTIEAAPGLASQPVLDGNQGASTGCSTTACNGPVLTVPAGEYVALTGITIANGLNGLNGGGGGLNNAGTVTITGCAFTGNVGGLGGAIDTGDGSKLGLGGTGSVTVTGSTFTGNSAIAGGAIASGAGGGGNGGGAGGGSVTVTGSTFTNNSVGGSLIGVNPGGAIDSGDGALGTGGGGTVTVTASTFTGNFGSGGGIASGFDGGGGTVTVTGSTFTGNGGGNGAAIDSGDHGAGTVTVTDSTFSGNEAHPGNGGAIDSGESGGGTLTVTGSTFTGNVADQAQTGLYGLGDAIASGNSDGLPGGGGGTVQVAGNIFDNTCARGSGTWTDGGYNPGTDPTCFNGGPGDTSGSAVGSDLQAGLTGNGGPTKTIEPTAGNPAIGLIPDPTLITLGGSSVFLCGAVDQRGYETAAGTSCDAGAVQTAGVPSALTVTTSAAPATFNAAGQVITYSYLVRDTGTGLGVNGITVTDPAVPGVSCPSRVLPGGQSETCTGTYTTTAADLAAGKITDTATVAGYAANGVPVAPSTATVTVPEDWPPAVTGVHQPAAHAAEGYYLGVTNGTWTLAVTHPGTGKLTFAGTITLNAGAFRNLARVNLGTGDSAQVTRKTLTFHVTDNGAVKGIKFATTPANTKITFTLNIGGHPATASQLFLGGKPAHPPSGSPLTFTR
jgi:hypothetical protein